LVKMKLSFVSLVFSERKAELEKESSKLSLL